MMVHMNNTKRIAAIAAATVAASTFAVPAFAGDAETTVTAVWVVPTGTTEAGASQVTQTLWGTSEGGELDFSALPCNTMLQIDGYTSSPEAIAAVLADRKLVPGEDSRIFNGNFSFQYTPECEVTAGTPEKRREVAHQVPVETVNYIAPKVYRQVQKDTYLYAYQRGTWKNGKKLTSTKPFTQQQRDDLTESRYADIARGTLLYRKGSAAPIWWGSTRSVITPKVDICQLATDKAGDNIDMWVLDPAATARLPWGKGGKLAQRHLNAQKKALCQPRKVVTTEFKTVYTVEVTPARPGGVVEAFYCPREDQQGWVKVPEGTKCVVQFARELKIRQ